MPSQPVPFAIDGRNTLQTDVAYHDYFLLYSFIDAEWSRPPLRETSFRSEISRIADEFTTACCRYRDRVNGHAAKWFKANGGGGKTPQLAKHLFTPLCLVPFGHADDLAFVLVDDLHPVHSLTSEISTTIEELGMALCPKKDSLIRSAENSPAIEDRNGILCDLHTLIKRKPRALRGGDEGARYRAVEQPIQATHPLVVFSRFKMDGLAALGQPLLCQRAIFRLMMRRTVLVQDALFQAAKNKDPNVAPLISEEDARCVKLVPLDLQGAEEIGTLVFCRNYSVAMSLAMAMTTFTFGDILDEDERLSTLLQIKEAHRAVAFVRNQLRGETGCDISSLRDNHACRWLHSSLAASYESYSNPDGKQLGGFVDACGKFQISPGHLREVNRLVKMASCSKSERQAARRAARAQPLACAAGFYDTAIPCDKGDRSTADSLIPINRVLETSRDNLERFIKQVCVQGKGRDIYDFATEVLVPVPSRIGGLTDSESILAGRVKNAHFSMSDVLRAIQARLCLARETCGPGNRGGRLAIKALRDSMRAARIPAGLRRTVAFLYQNYSTLLADPLLYDSVLDLYDPMAALHGALTGAATRRDDTPPVPLSDELAQELSEYVDAINNALTHRVLKPHIEARVRDMAIDFRGALNQIVAAGDAPAKCGLGLYKHYVPKSGLADRYYGCPDVAVVSRLSYVPGATCHRLKLGSRAGRGRRPILVYFDVDTSHFLHVSGYGDYLHEAFHLVADEHCRKHLPAKETAGIIVLRERLSEVMVQMLCLAFLFHGDVETFCRHNVCSYAGSLVSVGTDDTETTVRASEFLTRLFLATYPFGKVRVDECAKWTREEWASFWNVSTPPKREMQKFVSDMQPFLYEFDTLLRSADTCRAVSQFVLQHFDSVWEAVWEAMPGLCYNAFQTYRRFNREVALSRHGGSDHTERLCGDVEDALKSGRPLVRNLYRNPRFFSADAVPDADGTQRRFSDRSGLDPLVLLNTLMHSYIRSRHEVWDFSRGLHVPRNGEDGMVDFSLQQEPMREGWNTWQIDRGLDSLFSPSPDARKERLRMQSVILKTSWDIAGSLRARRLRRIILDNWGSDVEDALAYDQRDAKTLALFGN